MFCPNCGAKAVDSQKFCMKCGEKIEQTQDKQNESELNDASLINEKETSADLQHGEKPAEVVETALPSEKPVASGSLGVRKIYIAIGGVAAVIAAILIITLVIMPLSSYNKALKQFNNKQYIEAFASLEKLSTGYKDVKELLPYYEAFAAFESGSYKQAARLFDDLGKYKKSDDMKDESNYLNATELLSAGKYDDAYAAFSSILSYEDSAEMINECRYLQAMSFIKSDGAKAKAIFAGLGSYKDSYDKLTECDYFTAMKLLDSKKFEEAYTAFQQLGDYKDSQEKINECHYMEGHYLFEQKYYEEAFNAFKLASGYKDSDTMLLECHYLLALELIDSKNYESAAKLLAGLGDYKDSLALKKQYRTITVGFASLYASQFNYQAAITKSIQEAFSEENGYKLLVGDGQGDTARMLYTINDYISQGVDYIVVTTDFAVDLNSILQSAKDNEIPVIIVGHSNNIDEDLYVSSVNIDYKAEAVMVAEWMNSHFGGNPVRIVHIQGVPYSDVSIVRGEALQEAVSKHSNWALIGQGVADWDYSLANDWMSNWIIALGNIDCVYAENETMAFGAIGALNSAGIKVGEGGVSVVTFDAGSEGLRSVLEGQISCDAGPDLKYGAKLAEIITTIENGAQPAKFNAINSIVFSKDNISQEIVNSRPY